MKRMRHFERKKKSRHTSLLAAALLSAALLLTEGCRILDKDAGITPAEKASAATGKEPGTLDGKDTEEIFPQAAKEALTAALIPTPEPEVYVPETLGNPRSIFGLGSALYLEGKNILLSLFVTTPESGWEDEDREWVLSKLETAVNYIEARALDYGVGTELLYDWTSDSDLKAEVEVDFLINEDFDYIHHLDKEIELWFDSIVSYEDLLEEYDAEGIAACIFINNPGISYANAYDGRGNEQESVVLFTGDYYWEDHEEAAATYAHEILHLFGAHDLYEDAEYTKEVTDYLADTYPEEIMITVAGSRDSIAKTLSPVTAYHLGWLDYTQEVDQYPQLNRRKEE